MTLLDNILKKAQSVLVLSEHSLSTKPKSPPPDSETIADIVKEKKKRHRPRCPYPGARAKVDSSPPRYSARPLYIKVPDWRARHLRTQYDNLQLLIAFKKTHYARGRVDCWWRVEPQPFRHFYYNRVAFSKHVRFENKLLHKRLVTQGPKVVPTESLQRDWARNRVDILKRARKPFVLFPPIPQDDIEDPAFVKPEGVKRPRVFFTMRVEGCAAIGELEAELFTDVCPRTASLFVELLVGHEGGFSYVGTHFYRKVPHLYWAGGDVVHDNGFGCYLQSGRRYPIGAENYHFSHSMPGLLSMRVTSDNEICGVFNITFKPLPQFDLKNVVFGRIVRPSEVFNSITKIGRALATTPRVLLCASRMKIRGQWVQGTPNTSFIQPVRRVF
ncbi:uncharacterized protein LOC126378759 [Pectinophora gossypiella]|uniref:uncharacterized protein LOC126378759 n=1 Tax=Pectinophora gossypiella TaxID=13191 RepID=UPI00214E30DC|nr:uncharacterized protein LOC126378759 [Pectinophora gossypiella]